ncbi:hypothetical protein TURU_083221 [Turdus rufiventris]|nr:hypothetical protein TURU_083221 [Turdus rufiventris]
MDCDLLDLPLGVKIRVKPKTKTVFCRGKLGETVSLLQSQMAQHCQDDPETCAGSRQETLSLSHKVQKGPPDLLKFSERIQGAAGCSQWFSQ